MVLADSYLHTLDPFVIEFSSGFGVRWYGLSYAMGFLVAWMMIRWISRRSWSPLPPQKVGDLMFAVILGVLLGGRLGYAIFYEPHLFIGFSKSLPYWDLLAINKGGMASHGGMIGVIISVWWFGMKNNTSSLHLLDLAGMATTPGLCLGRIANFINAELWGKPLPDSMQSYVAGRGLTGVDPPWWSIKYAQEITEVWLPIVNHPQRHSPQLVQDAQERLDLAAQQLAPIIPPSGNFFDQAVHAARDTSVALHEQVALAIKPLLTAFYPSQIFQAITDGPILFGLLVLIWLRPRKPGVVGSWFLIWYGILRIATEVFRQPDAGVPLTFGLLSRGQTLSLLMIVIGLVCLRIATKRDVPPIGGLFAGGVKPTTGVAKQ